MDYLSNLPGLILAAAARLLDISAGKHKKVALTFQLRMIAIAQSSAALVSAPGHSCSGWEG
jgi:hypothetical protein